MPHFVTIYSIMHVKRRFLFLFGCSSFTAACELEDLDSEVANAGDGDTLKELEEESRRRIELEAEERKLEETLEYQRRIENEAKQKHLAEQHKKNVKINQPEMNAVVTFINDGDVSLNDKNMVIC